MNWSQYQKDIFEAVSGTRDSLIIEAVAGSGKTTTIVEAIKHVPGSESVVFLAFNKSIADELKRRVTQPNAQCKTLHALGLSAWKKFLYWDAGDLRVDGKKVREIVDDLELPYGHWTKEMGKLVSLAKGGGMVPKGLEGKYHGLAVDSDDAWEETYERYDIDPEQVDLELVRKVLTISIERAREVIDFDDMLYMPIITGAEFEKVDVVFVDEAQDVNGIQAEIVDRMRHERTRVIVVGDPNQSIYGFRGAMHDSMQILQERFHCHALPLSVSYRCSKKVVAKAREWVSHILHHDAAEEGLVAHAGDWKVEDFRPGDAVLCRNARPVVAMAFFLIRNKVAARVVGRDIGQGLVSLVNKMKARGIADLDDRLRVYREREKLRAKGSESKMAALDDKLDTIRVFMDECGPHAGIGTLIHSIEALFGESAEMWGVVTCSTVHKAKGMEWDRVFVLDADIYMPSKWARQPWERQQEDNLQYVAATRTKRELRYISTESLRVMKERGDAKTIQSKELQSAPRDEDSTGSVARELDEDAAAQAAGAQEDRAR